MEPSRPFDAILFDLGGVLLEVDFARALNYWSGRSNVPADLLGSRFTIDDFYEAHERGEIDSSAYFSALRDTLGINLPDNEFGAGWNAILGNPIRETCALLPSLKQSFPLYLFSNSNPTHYHQWK